MSNFIKVGNLSMMNNENLFFILKLFIGIGGCCFFIIGIYSLLQVRKIIHSKIGQALSAKDEDKINHLLKRSKMGYIGFFFLLLSLIFIYFY